MTRTAALRADARGCLAAAMAAIDPARLTGAQLDWNDGTLVLRGQGSAQSVAPCPRPHGGPVLVVGAGKAALGMAAGVRSVLPRATGLVIVPYGTPGLAPADIEVRRASHPIPDAAGVEATQELLARVAGAGPETLVIVLLSGGASALLVAPADGITLEDKQGVTRALLAAGADIAALNAVRKHCSAVKGGGLARRAAAAAGCWTLLLSDVIGDDPAVIASGPTVGDPSTWAEVARILERWLDPDEVPDAVRQRIAAGMAGRLPETVKPGDPVLARVVVRIVGNNALAVAAAAEEARRRGYAVTVHPRAIVGDAAASGRELAAALRALPTDRPAALVAGGEPTVQVRPGGHGGRAQHLALAAAIALAGTPAVLLAAGTDGVDGPTAAAGACVDGETVWRARAAGHDPEAALRATNSSAPLAAAGDLLPGGPSGTNVADLVVGLRPAC